MLVYYTTSDTPTVAESIETSTANFQDVVKDIVEHGGVYLGYTL